LGHFLPEIDDAILKIDSRVLLCGDLTVIKRFHFHARNNFEEWMEAFRRTLAARSELADESDTRSRR
jgi:hypothetical protein